MKKVLLMAAVAAVFTACQKGDEPKPALTAQTVTYEVECKNCIVYVEDTYWNRNSETERSKNKHFVVSGKWKYEFENSNLDSVQMTIAVSAIGAKQLVKASILTNDKRQVFFNDYLGFNLDNPYDDYPFETTLDLKLN